MEGKTVHTNSQTVTLNLTLVLCWGFLDIQYLAYEFDITPLHFCVFEFTSEYTQQLMPINLMLWDHPSMLECEGKHFSMNSAGESPAGVRLHCEGQIVLHLI